MDQVACLNNEKILEKYFKEEDVLAQDSNAEEYKDWVHIRSYGSYPLDSSHNKNTLKV